MASHSPAKQALFPLSDEQIASLPDLPTAIASIRLYGIKTEGVTNLEEAKIALFRNLRRKVSKSIRVFMCVCVCNNNKMFQNFAKQPSRKKDNCNSIQALLFFLRIVYASFFFLAFYFFA